LDNRHPTRSGARGPIEAVRRDAFRGLVGAKAARRVKSGRFDKADFTMIEDIADREPFAPFERWLSLAEQSEKLAETMTLATATADGRPSVRAVLLKGVDQRGFVFYTNLESRKSGELFVNPHAAL